MVAIVASAMCRSASRRFVASANTKQASAKASSLRLAILSNYRIFAEPLLSRLSGLPNVEVVIVSTKPDVESVCQERGIRFISFPGTVPFAQFTKACKEDPVFRSEVEASYDAIRAFMPDVLFTAGFFIIPPEVVAIPRVAALNMHPSELPRYRGGLPLQAFILRGEPSFRVCIHRLSEVIDDPRGVLVYSEEQPVPADATLGPLMDLVASTIPPLFEQALEQVLAPADSPITPEPLAVPPADLPHSFGIRGEKVLDPETGKERRSNAGLLARARIEWHEDSAVDIERAVRALTGLYGCFTDFAGAAWRIEQCRIAHTEHGAGPVPPGSVIALPDDHSAVVVATCCGGAVELVGQFVESTAAPEVCVGGAFSSVTPLSQLTGLPGVDRLPGGTRYA